SQQRADTRIANLSGGEKARLLFALMSVDSPQLLLLDEPTNHLDMASREALVQAINEFEGAVVIVSHDPHVVELIADRLWPDGGPVTRSEGDRETYATLAIPRARAAPESPLATADSKREQRRTAAEKRRALAPLKKQIDAAEARVGTLEQERAALHEMLAQRF